MSAHFLHKSSPLLALTFTFKAICFSIVAPDGPRDRGAGEPLGAVGVKPADLGGPRFHYHLQNNESLKL